MPSATDAFCGTLNDLENVFLDTPEELTSAKAAKHLFNAVEALIVTKGKDCAYTIEENMHSSDRVLCYIEAGGKSRTMIALEDKFGEVASLPVLMTHDPERYDHLVFTLAKICNELKPA